MTKDRKEQDSRRVITEDSKEKVYRRDIDFGEGLGVGRTRHDVTDTLSPPPRRDKGNSNGNSND